MSNFPSAETSDAMEDFIWMNCETPILQVVDGGRFFRIPYPEFRYVEWKEVGNETSRVQRCAAEHSAA
jgi:hypothetical protein